MRGRGEGSGRNINILYLDVIRVIFCFFRSIPNEDRLGFDGDVELISHGILDKLL